jgi:hypothetical protein
MWGPAGQASREEDEASSAQFSALYTADALWNAQGGLREGGADLDSLELADAWVIGQRVELLVRR